MRSTITLLVSLVLALGLAGSASASTPYPIPPPDASVSDPVVAPGEDFTFFAEGFLPGSTVTVTVTLVDAQAAGDLDVVAGGGGRMSAGFVVVRTAAATSQTFTRVADSQGRISLPLDLSATGSYQIVASGVNEDGDPFSVTSTVLVADDADGSGTGSDSGTDGSAGAGGSSGANGSPRAVLARTGVDNVATLAWAGFGVLVLGGLLVTVASGRRRTHDLQDA